MDDGRRVKICVATSTRADWGLLMPIAAEMRRDSRVELQVLATNMHLLERYGHTADEIEADGFEIDARVVMPDADDSEAARARAAGICLEGAAREFERLRPDVVVILGDRYEMLAIATAAAIMRLPIVHIAGGEISEGAIDDSLRHAITKLATLHLTATERYRRRVIQMGEAPGSVVNIGAPGVWNAFNQELPTPRQVYDSLGIDGEPKLMLVTYHPATLDDVDPAVRFAALLEALDRFADYHAIITYPNNDARSQGVIAKIEDYARKNPGRVTAVKSLGMKRYLAASKMASAVVGNSSSGIVEVPSAGTPTVDVGIRQQGRIAGESVIHCGDSTDEIAAAIARALSPEMQSLAACKENPYARPDTVPLAASTIVDFALNRRGETKKFYDLSC